MHFIHNDKEIKDINVITDEICAEVFGSFSAAQIVWYKNAKKEEKKSGHKDCPFFFYSDELHDFAFFVVLIILSEPLECYKGHLLLLAISLR